GCRQEAIHHNWPRRIRPSDRLDLPLDERGGQTPGVLESESIHGLVFNLPGDDRPVALVAIHDAGDEFGRGREQVWMRGWSDLRRAKADPEERFAAGLDR